MDCCTYRCTESDGCPVRRVRAGTVPDDMPVQFAETEPPLADDPEPELTKMLCFIGGIACCFVVMSLAIIIF